MYSRLKEIRKAYNLTQSEFAESIGKSRDAYCNYEYGRVLPDDTVIKLICSTYNVDVHWLRTGEGSMHPAPADNDKLQRLIAEALGGKPDNVKRAALEIFADLDDRGWEALYYFMKQIKGSDK